MHLSTSQTRALGEVMRLLADATDSDALRQALALPMLELLSADTYCSMVWNGARGRFERYAAVNMSEDNLRRWDQHYRFVDPLTLPMMARRRPTIATQVVSMSELSRTEFFNDFLQRDRMHWGVNVYFHEGEECVGDFRIWRYRDRGNFETNELELLRMVEPSITAALGRLRREDVGLASPEAIGRAEEQLQHGAPLSRREAEVAWLVSCGCPDKEIARRLSLRYPTVRFHLTNAFRKLKADNRAALASRVRAIVGMSRGQGLDAPPRS